MVIAVLDSGIRPTHVAFASDQIVAWRDFVNGRTTPYDDQGHGTRVASMAAGKPTPGMTPSFAPGAKLAVAKILSADNFASWYHTAAAIRWAVDVAGADVITLSIYSYAPTVTGPLHGASGEEVLDAIAYARSKGAITTVLAGNGAYNYGVVPSMSYFHTPGVSTDALIVGGASSMGLPTAPLGTMESEVTSLYTVQSACSAFDTCVSQSSGTSFSTPRVAGMAARLIAEARAAGIVTTPEEIEARIKAAARDSPAPPTLEGYGFIGQPEVDAAVAALLARQAPQPNPVNALYVENVQASSRALWRGD